MDKQQKDKRNSFLALFSFFLFSFFLFSIFIFFLFSSYPNTSPRWIFVFAD